MSSSRATYVGVCDTDDSKHFECAVIVNAVRRQAPTTSLQSPGITPPLPADRMNHVPQDLPPDGG